MKNILCALLIVASLLSSQSIFSQNEVVSKIPALENERWWGALVGLGHEMPFKTTTRVYDLERENFNNQQVPLFLSNKGRIVWADKPFKFQFSNYTLIVSSRFGEKVVAEQGGKTLRDAYLTASKKYFPPTGVIPEADFFSKPQYNTWIELMYDQNQADILKYADDIIASNLPTGIFMIDDNWQRYYGNFEFRLEKFPDAKAMTDQLHAQGFSVMVWVCPYVSPDSQEFRELAQKNFLVKDKNGKPAIIYWWNGFSACYDMTNPAAVDYLRKQLKGAQEKYGIDGFKFDGADVGYMLGEYKYHDSNANNNDFTEAWAAFGKEFPFNELRTSWKLGGTELVQRLGDKDYSWNATSMLIPQMTVAGLLGHAYTCPDMIGGGQFSAFLNISSDAFDQELIVRSAQTHALMPMMQFSVAPWRILDKEHLDIVVEAAQLHEKFGDYILDYAKKSSQTGEPIIRSMEYSFPNEGFEECSDQFMLGEKFLVAPILTSGVERTVKLPKGRWKDDANKTYKGGQTIKVAAPISRLPFFEKTN